MLKLMPDQMEVLLQTCRNHRLFQKHPQAELKQLVAKMSELNLAMGEVLFHAGDVGTDMFVLQSGELSCITKDGVVVNVLRADKCGVCFGEGTKLKINYFRKS